MGQPGPSTGQLQRQILTVKLFNNKPGADVRNRGTSEASPLHSVTQRQYGHCGQSVTKLSPQHDKDSFSPLGFHGSVGNELLFQSPGPV